MGRNSMKISMIIPTLNAESSVGSLLDALFSQTVQLDEIIVIDSSSSDETVSEVLKYSSVILKTIDRTTFNHGLTRDMALRMSKGDVVCFMTQDAIPANDRYIEHLIEPLLKDRDIAVSYGRQLPKTEARRFEQLVREFNYTDESAVRSIKDVKSLGIKAYFSTDVCSAYRRTDYLKLGGFDRTDMSEDMLFAAKAINAGMRVAYAADACVYHSHNFTFLQQFKRNKAIGEFLESHSRELMGVGEISEGTKLVRSVSSQLIREGRLGEFIAFAVDCLARLLGNRVGRLSQKRINNN